MKEITYVIGHKNPDTDSICSAIALAVLKTAEGEENVIPARAGDLNHQTSFVLNLFNIQPPKFLSNVYPRAKDIMTDCVYSVQEETPLYKVMQAIRDKNIRFVPVLNKNDKPMGIITLMDLAKKQITQAEVAGSREVTTTLDNIIETLGAETITNFWGKEERTFSLYVGAMRTKSFLDVLKDTDPANCAVIVGDRENIQKASVDMGIGLIIVAGGLKVSEEIIAAAKENKVSIAVSPFDTATSAQLVRASTPAKNIANSNFQTAFPDDLAEDIKQRIKGHTERGLIVLDPERGGALCGVITKSDLLKPSTVNLVLVDHNELLQAVDGADEVRIREVVDHHRLGNFHTMEPISFICEPVGSTSTIVAELYKKRNISIEKHISGLLLSGVMSDTVMLRSPTTTDRDREIVPWLEEKSGLSHTELGEKIFSAASSLKARGATGVIGDDFKTYEAKGEKFGIGQVEVIGFGEFHDEEVALKEELLRVAAAKDLKLAALLVTDITLGTSLLLAIGEGKAIYELDYPRVSENVYELKDVLSRKKQVAPHLISLFNEIY